MTGAWVDHGDGHQSCRVGQHLLEIKRNTDPHDKRRYYAYVSGEEVPTPTWSPSQAKTKAIKAMERGYITVRTARRQDRFEEPVEQNQPDMVLATGDHVAVCEFKRTMDTEVFDPVDHMLDPAPNNLPEIQYADYADLPMDEVRFVIKGHFDLNNFSGSMSALHSAVELLRELGPTFCDVYPPNKITI